MAKAFTTTDRTIFNSKQTWQSCNFCSSQTFKASTDFLRHLRERHCTREGGSFVCRYGYKGVCASLPLDGVSDRDYVEHVMKFHMNSVNELPEEWSIYMAAQNLPAVLNDPSRGKQSNIFTKKWGDSFVEKVHISSSPFLADISYDHLEQYIRQIGKRHRRHLRLNQHLQQRGVLGTQSQQSTVATATKAITTTNATSGGLRNVTLNELDNASLDDIPSIFTKSNLDFAHADTFEAVFPGVNDADHLRSGRMLQEKLSHYLDIVEVQIAKQVSEKSSAFFHAMTSQDTIMEQMHQATKNVRKLREKMHQLDEKLVQDALKIVALERKRRHYGLVYDKLKLMATVHQTQPMIQLLLGTQDYVAALDLISTTQEIVAQELGGIHCFKHLPSQLIEMERLIDKMLATDFEKYSTIDLSRPLDDDEESEHVFDEDKLICIISGLLRQKNFSFIDTYKDEAIVAIRAMIKQLVIEVIATGDDERCLTGSGEVSQCLTISEWTILLRRATVLLLRLLRRIKAVLTVMHQISEASAGGDGSSTLDESFDVVETFLDAADHKCIEEKLNDVMHSICNYCHERCANLISTQSLEKHVASGDELQSLSEIVRDFSRGCEQLSGTQRIPLTVALQAQATKFAQKFHGERKSKLSLLLDNERWKQTDVPCEYQHIIDRIANDDFQWTTKNDELVKRPPTSTLCVDGEPFALVGSALVLVQIVCEYCQCGTNLPILATTMSRHLVDLLRTFNSKCCQLVLGAGALRVAGLTTITTGNLALVSRALQLVIWLLPRLKTHFHQIETAHIATASPTIVAHTPMGNGTTNHNNLSNNNFINSGYDSVEKDFYSHIKEIESKVLTIVTSLVHSQLNNWNARPPVPSQSFRNISKHFVKLHEVLVPILPERQIHQLYRTVHKSFKDKLRELLLKYNIVNNGGPQHGVVIAELTFYMETLRTLKATTPDELDDDTFNDIWFK